MSSRGVSDSGCLDQGCECHILIALEEVLKCQSKGDKCHDNWPPAMFNKFLYIKFGGRKSPGMAAFLSLQVTHFFMHHLPLHLYRGESPLSFSGVDLVFLGAWSIYAAGVTLGLKKKVAAVKITSKKLMDSRVIALQILSEKKEAKLSVCQVKIKTLLETNRSVLDSSKILKISALAPTVAADHSWCHSVTLFAQKGLDVACSTLSWLSSSFERCLR